MLTYHAHIATTDAALALESVTSAAAAMAPGVTRVFLATPFADHAAQGFVTVAFDTANEVDADVIGLLFGCVTMPCLAL